MSSATKIAYVVCSANYLAYAKAMANSFMQHNPDYTFVIGLIDKIDGRFDVHDFHPYIIVEAEHIGRSYFDEMKDRYNALELSCAMKPFFAEYLLQQYNPQTLIYLDTDICVYQPLQYVEDVLTKHDILLTPHFTTPVNDGKHPKETDIINAGLYNAGFFAIANNSNALAFLQWWQERMKNQCYYNFTAGMGVDQTWLNFVPLYFPNVKIADNKGLNVAYWNLHERAISQKNNTYYVNGTEPLVFLHISGYDFNNTALISKHQNRHSFNQQPVLKVMIDAYRQSVLDCNHAFYAGLAYTYAKEKPKKGWRKLWGK